MTEAGKLARVGWDFQPSKPDELALEEGDLVTITAMPNDGWWEGELNGVVGWFPSNYVELLTEEEAREAFHAGSSDSTADGIDSDQNAQWYSNYQNEGGDAPEPEPEPEPERKIGGKITRVVLSAPSEAKPKWFDKVDGKILGALSEKEKKRQEVIFELIQTEKDFVRDLHIIITIFLQPLRKKKILPPKDLTVLFSNVEQLVPVNTELLRSLETRRAENPVVELVGDVFLRLADYFKMYNMYCSNHPFSLVKYQNLTSKAFKAFVAEAFQNPECRALDMCSFMIKPVQRICKYPLLIREMLKFTEESHSDYKNLEAAYERLEMVVTIVNEAIRQAEEVQKMLNIQARFSEKINFLTPSRRLLRDEQLVQLSDGKKKTRTVFLFTDLFVIAKEAGMMSSGDKLKVVDMVTLDAALIHDDEPESSNFQLTHSGHAKYIFVTDSVEIKKKWVDQLNELVTEEFERKQMELAYENNENFDFQEEEDVVVVEAPKPKLEISVPALTTSVKGEIPKGDTPTSATTTQGQPRTTSILVSSTSSPRFQPSPTPEPAADLGNVRANLRRTIIEKDEDSSSSVLTSSTNEAANLLQRLKQSPRPDAPKTTHDDATPEFLRVKNNLRRTIYEDEAAAQPQTGDLKAYKGKSKSVGDLGDAQIKEEEEELKAVASAPLGKKKKGFMANLFGKWFRSKSSASVSTSPDKNGESSKQPQKPSSPPTISTPNPSSTTTPPASTQQQQQSPQRPSQPVGARLSMGQSPVGAAQPRVHPSQPSPQPTSAQQGSKRTTTISVSPAANTGKVVAVNIKAYKKTTGPKEDYVYQIEVVRESATYLIQKTFDDFFNFHTGLIFQFPEEAGRRSQKRTLPDLPLQTAFLSESMAAQRRMELDRYLKKLFMLPEKIASSTYALKFLEPKDPSAIVPGANKGPAVPKSAVPSSSATTTTTVGGGQQQASRASHAPPVPSSTAPKNMAQRPGQKPRPPPPTSRNPAARNVGAK